MFNETFWVAVSFVIFIFLAFKPVRNMLIKMLDERAAKIHKELEEVTKLKDQALKTLSEYQTRQKDIEIEIRDIVSNAEKEIEKLQRNAEIEINNSFNNRTKRIADRINSQETKIINDFRYQAVDIAVTVVKEVIKDSLQEEVADNLITSSVNDLSKTIH